MAKPKGTASLASLGLLAAAVTAQHPSLSKHLCRIPGVALLALPVPVWPDTLCFASSQASPSPVQADVLPATPGPDSPPPSVVQVGSPQPRCEGCLGAKPAPSLPPARCLLRESGLTPTAQNLQVDGSQSQQIECVQNVPISFHLPHKPLPPRPSSPVHDTTTYNNAC